MSSPTLPQNAMLSHPVAVLKLARTCYGCAILAGVLLSVLIEASVVADEGKAAETGKAPVEEPSGGWRDWLEKNVQPEALKSQWSKASEYAKAMKASLESINPDELRKRFAELANAVQAEDWQKIEELAGSVGEVVNAHSLADALRFVVIQRQKGGEAAANAIDEYARRKDLNVIERAAVENLKRSMGFLARDDVRGALATAIIFACEREFGAHQGVLLAVPIITILFPDLALKQSSETQTQQQSPKS